MVADEGHPQTYIHCNNEEIKVTESIPEILKQFGE